MDIKEVNTEAAVVAEIAQAASVPTLLEINGVPTLAVPNGVTIEDYAEFMDAPKRLKSSPVFQDVESFGAYVNRFKATDTEVFSYDEQKVVAAIIDYHGKGKPRWCDHKADLKVSHTDDWKAWIGLCANPVSQVQFAEFIEDHIHNIGKPDAAVLKDMVLKFQSWKETTFKSALNLQNGDVSLTYIEDSERGNDAQTKLPSEMVLVVPIFEGQLPEQITAKLRYRIKDQKLTFQVQLLQQKEIVKRAWQEVLEAVGALTAIKPLRCP